MTCLFMDRSSQPIFAHNSAQGVFDYIPRREMTKSKSLNVKKKPSHELLEY